MTSRARPQVAEEERRQRSGRGEASASRRTEEPAARSSGTPSQPPRFRWWWIFLALGLLTFNYSAGSLAMREQPRLRVPYSPFFLEQVRNGNVAEITSEGSTVQGAFKQSRRFGNSQPTKQFETEIPAFADTDALSRLLESNYVVVNAEPLDTGAPWWQTLLVGFGPTLLLLGLLIFFLRRAGSTQSAIGAFGRSRARRYQPSGDRVTFADVAGVEETEAELVEVVDFLRRPEKYRRLGGRVPRGVLLVGPPGTGKTLLARAVAGEADVPFFSLSASEFVEAIVGIGASRVRDLFAQAKQAAPSIVFIDELDAVGRSRTAAAAGFSGGNDEREQTLNQILTEMDGFDASSNVIVLGATNRPEVLDPALLRPGRFDRRVAVQPPDRAGREQILRVHARGVPLAPTVDLGRIASSTPGMVGADLANLVNEAALLAARRAHDVVEESDFTDALERIVLGAERQIMIGPEDRRRTAYHEAGHAIVGMLTEGADPVRKISIIPRSTSLGVTFSAPDADRYNYQERELQARIKVALGGRGAEQIVFGSPTTGAESDIQQLTEIARNMVGRWGMSSAVGPLAVIPADGRGPLLPGSSDVSPDTQQLIDEEVRRIVDKAHQQVVALLSENRARLDSLAQALLEHETLDEDQAYAAADVSRIATGAGRERAMQPRMRRTSSEGAAQMRGVDMTERFEKAILAGGCFWGMQDLFRRQPGVLSTRVGYSGGDVPDATYRNHGSHAEAIEIVFDPAQTSYRDLLEFFFQIHDPTTLNRQGNDIGASYRSAIFYVDDEQRRVAEETIVDVERSGRWPGRVVTDVAAAGPFWEAEPEHQDYLERYPNGYTCHFVRPDWVLPKPVKSGVG